MKALIEYEMRRTFTVKVLVSLGTFTVFMALCLTITSGLYSPLEVRLLQADYINAHYRTYSVFMINYALLAWCVWLSNSLFSRNREDIVLIIRKRRNRVWGVKIMIGIAFMVYLTLLMTLLNHAVLQWMNAFTYPFRAYLEAWTRFTLYYFTLFSALALVQKSPRIFIFVLPLIFTIDTLTHTMDQSKTALEIIMSTVFPMVNAVVTSPENSVSIWATLTMSGLFLFIGHYIMKEKPY